jgi:MYXO-CTERM domain-containing protein
MKKLNELQTKTARRIATAIAGLMFILAPTAALAERVEIDCNSLDPDKEMQIFYDLSAQSIELVREKNYTEAQAVAEQAMSMCTTDVLTEYTLARIYQLTNNCPKAYYHFEKLTQRSEDVQKENADVYKELNKHFKEVRSKCPDVYTLEISCETPDVELQISGIGSMTNVKCPFEAKVKAGEYPVVSTREGYKTRKDSVTVSEAGGKLNIPPLKQISTVADVVIRCPRGATTFILTDSSGNDEIHPCPWEDKLAADTYKIRLSGTDIKDATELVVEPKTQVDYMIPNAAKTNCSATPMSNSKAPLAAGLFMLLGALGLAARRRRS